MALTHCILGSFLGLGCHCFPPPLDVPTFASRCLQVQATWQTFISERRNYGREMAGQFCLWFRLPRKPRVLWHLRHRRRLYFPPQGRHAVDFFARKIRRLRPGSNPRSWVPEASMLTTRPPEYTPPVIPSVASCISRYCNATTNIPLYYGVAFQGC